MEEVDPEIIRAFRRKTFRYDPSSRVRSREEAIQYVNERGFIFFWPIKGIPMPSLWVAAAGDRPVAEEHDDLGHITWRWKDELLGKGAWYYGRVLAHKNCMISNEMLPYLYALSPNYGEPESDYLEDYLRGFLPLEAKIVYEVLLKEGALDSISLRKAAHLSGAGSESRFNKALDILQTTFRIVPCGTSTKGAWHYSFVYDAFHRHFVDAIDKSKDISESSARINLLKTYLLSVGFCQQHDLVKIFHWELSVLKNTILTMVDANQIFDDVIVKNEKHRHICLVELI